MRPFHALNLKQNPSRYGIIIFFGDLNCRTDSAFAPSGRSACEQLRSEADAIFRTGRITLNYWKIMWDFKELSESYPENLRTYIVHGSTDLYTGFFSWKMARSAFSYPAVFMLCVGFDP